MLAKRNEVQVYVINKHGRPLMPTTPRKARLLLKSGKALIVRRDPFTIQLIYGSSGYTQPVDLGIDAGYENIGFSAVNEKEEVLGGELKMLKGMSEKITEKRKYRRTRRNRLRYRKPRFSNRKKDKGWLAPSIQHKLDTHHRLIDTKGKRRELEIEKSHHNDAFVIAGGTIQTRVLKPLMLEQIRRNKRSLEQFYDAKYRDLRDGEIRSGSELSSGRRTRNIKLNSENLRQYRAHKVSAGRRSIKKKRYPYKQHDLVFFEGTIYEVIGMQNKGAGVKLKNYPEVKNKVVKPSVVKPIRKRGGMCEAI